MYNIKKLVLYPEAGNQQSRRYLQTPTNIKTKLKKVKVRLREVLKIHLKEIDEIGFTINENEKWSLKCSVKIVPES